MFFTQKSTLFLEFGMICLLAKFLRTRRFQMFSRGPFFVNFAKINHLNPLCAGVFSKIVSILPKFILRTTISQEVDRFQHQDTRFAAQMFS